MSVAGGGRSSGAQPASTKPVATAQPRGGVVTGQAVTGSIATGYPVTGRVATGIPVGIASGTAGANRPYSQIVQQRYSGPYTTTPAGLYVTLPLHYIGHQGD
jgi:hypothetical protein